MTNFSFAQAKRINIGTIPTPVQKYDTAFDPSLNFNREVGKPSVKGNIPNYSIHVNALLAKLSREDIDSLLKITLVANSIPHGMGMWDTVFNSQYHGRQSACLFTAKGDYTPLSQQRVITQRQYLDLSMSTTRLHLNRVEVGDVVGIGIYDTTSLHSYALIYEITHNNCLVQERKSSKGKIKVDDIAQMLPAINCQLKMVFKVDPLGDAVVMDVTGKEGHDESVSPFVNHLINSVIDIDHAYPWKPHFLPQKVLAPLNRQVIEERLLVEIDQGRHCEYDDFKFACRDLYNARRKIKIDKQRAEQNTKVEKTKGRKKPDPHVLPEVEVVTLGNGSVFAQFKDLDGVYQTFLFDKDTISTNAVSEVYFTNTDLSGVDLVDKTDVLALSPDKFGEHGVLRYFTMNF